MLVSRFVGCATCCTRVYFIRVCKNRICTPYILIYYAAVLIILLSWMTSTSVAKVVCIRLTSEHTADTTV
jgi:ABC-type enterochelin transport system permease subunit